MFGLVEEPSGLCERITVAFVCFYKIDLLTKVGLIFTLYRREIIGLAFKPWLLKHTACLSLNWRLLLGSTVSFSK